MTYKEQTFILKILDPATVNYSYFNRYRIKFTAEFGRLPEFSTLTEAALTYNLVSTPPDFHQSNSMITLFCCILGDFLELNRIDLEI